MASLFAQQLKRLGACSKAIEWVENKEFGEAWASCEDSYWLFWLAEKLGVDPKLFIQIACRCTRLVLHLVPKGEERPREAIEAAEAWLEGKVSIKEVQAAAEAAWTVWAAATSTRATLAAWAAAEAVWVTNIARVIDLTDVAIRAAEAATWAAEAVSSATMAAARVTGNNDIKQQIFSIIREVMTEPVREKLAALKV